MYRILLVEDEILMSFSTSLALEDAGHRVLVAHDGREGLEMALQERPDLIVTDLMMPRMTGLEMIAALREQGYEGPIILATSIAEEHLPSRTGFQAFLQKPFTEDELDRLIRAVGPADGPAQGA